MTKDQYLILLRAELTGHIPEEELEDIIRYYNEYFEEAGPERERDVMVELGSPERLGQKILNQEDFRESAAGGEAQAYAYQPAGEENGMEAIRRNWSAPANGPLPAWLFIVLAVLAGMVVVPTVAGVVLGLGVGGIACIAVGVGVAMGGMKAGGLSAVLCLAGVGIMAVALGMFLIFVAASIFEGVVRAARSWTGYLWSKFVLGEEEPYAE